MLKKLKIGDLIKIKYDHIVKVKKDKKFIYYIPNAGVITKIFGDKAIVMWMETNCPEIDAISLKVFQEYDEYFLDSLTLYEPYLNKISKKNLSSLQEK